MRRRKGGFAYGCKGQMEGIKKDGLSIRRIMNFSRQVGTSLYNPNSRSARADKVIVDPGRTGTGKWEEEEKCKSESACCNFERAVIFTRGIALGPGPLFSTLDHG